MEMTTNVDLYFVDGCGRCELGGTPNCKVKTWHEELAAVRGILAGTGLQEECKWGCPCYTHKGKNIAMLAAFKDSVRLSFFKGVLIEDPKNLLEFAGENSQSGKHFTFKNIDEINNLESLIINYIEQAIEIEIKGLKVDFPEKDNLELPEELLEKFRDDPELEMAFGSLTPGRQRGYNLHFSQPKNSETRLSRINKMRDKIIAGKGFHDR